jgi:hypothetical protein
MERGKRKAGMNATADRFEGSRSHSNTGTAVCAMHCRLMSVDASFVGEHGGGKDVKQGPTLW